MACLYIRRRASPLCRDPASQLNSLSRFVFVYMRGGPALLGGISLLTTEISPRRDGNFPYKENLDPPRRTSKSKLHTHDKCCLDQHFLDNLSFHKLCFLCVGSKWKLVRKYRIPSTWENNCSLIAQVTRLSEWSFQKLSFFLASVQL